MAGVLLVGVSAEGGSWYEHPRDISGTSAETAAGNRKLKYTYASMAHKIYGSSRGRRHVARL